MGFEIEILLMVTGQPYHKFTIQSKANKITLRYSTVLPLGKNFQYTTQIGHSQHTTLQGPYH